MINKLFTDKNYKPSDDETKNLLKELFDELHWDHTLSKEELSMLDKARWHKLCRCGKRVLNESDRCDLHFNT